MVDDAYDTLGWRIMTDPYLCPGRIYDPEIETDEDMPEGIFHLLPHYLTHREVLQVRFSEGGDEVSLSRFSGLYVRSGSHLFRLPTLRYPKQLQRRKQTGS